MPINPMLPAPLAVDRALYRASYYDFFRDAYAVLHPGMEPLDDNWHIRELCNELQAEAERIYRREPKTKDLIINMPFRAGKSLIVSVCFNAWVWSWFPAAKFICVSYEEGVALILAMKTRTLVQSPWYQTLFPGVTLKADQNQKGFFETEAGGMRYSVGTGGAVTSLGADFVIIDDAQNPKKATSATERATTISYYTTTLFSRLNNASIGIRINVQQRLHAEDLSGYLLATNPDGHRHICVPAEITDLTPVIPAEWAGYYTDGLFFPARFSKAVLTDYHKTLGPRQYANQLQQQPSPAEGDVFKKAWFPITTTRPSGTVNFFVDTASTEEEKNDATAIIACIKSGEEWTILHSMTVRKAMPELVEWIKTYAAQHGSSASRFYIENKSSGIALLQLLRKSTKLHVSPLEPGKLSKRERAELATPPCADGRVKLLAGPWNEGFLGEVTTYPTGKHDDVVDALAYMVNTTTSTGWKSYGS